MMEDRDDSLPTVYALDPASTHEDIEENTPYRGTVNGVVPYGIFVDLSEGISGLAHESTLPRAYEVGEDVVVTVTEIRPNGDIALEVLDFDDYELVEQDASITLTPIGEISTEHASVTVEGRIDQIKQTAGPTIFSITDGAQVIGGAAFESAGVRAFPEVDRGDVVRMRGSPERHNGGLQVEVDSLEILSGDEAASVRDAIESGIETRAITPDIDPLVEWEPLSTLWDPLERLASDLKRAMLESRPVRIRHHADVDGICAALPLVVALERFAETVHVDSENTQHLISRAPSRAPFYELEDATRDLSRALEHRERHGQRLPLLLMLDNGSTEEDVAAYRNLAHYDIPISVVDHHHPDTEAVDGLLTHHINPYLIGEDYRVTTGMLCVEVARMIDPGITETVRHLPAVAGIADRSEAQSMDRYLAVAADAGYSRTEVERVGEALDYASHWLKYRSGSRLIRDVLGIGPADGDRQEALISLFSNGAREAIDEQLAAASPHVRTEQLPNGAQLHQLDVDAHAHRFRYPAPGKTTGSLHDKHVERSGDPTITMGVGPDFCVLRSDGVRLDIPTMVDNIRSALPGAGVEGGGHLVVGSVKFVPGMREAVLDALVERMGEPPIDRELSSAWSPSDPA